MKEDLKVFDEDVTIIDDHAHHPSAVRETLSILENERVHLLYYPKTHTQRLDIHHKDTLEVLSVPYAAYILLPDNHMLNTTAYQNAGIQLGDTSLIVKALLQKVKKKDVILICTPYYLCDIVKQLKNGLRKKGCIVG